MKLNIVPYLKEHKFQSTSDPQILGKVHSCSQCTKASDTSRNTGDNPNQLFSQISFLTLQNKY